jgi:hypothetical protein
MVMVSAGRCVLVGLGWALMAYTFEIQCVDKVCVSFPDAVVPVQRELDQKFPSGKIP